MLPMNQQPNELAPIQIATVAAPRNCIEHLDFVGFEPQLDDNAFHAEKRTTVPSVSQGERRKDVLTIYWSGRCQLFLCRWKLYQLQLQLQLRQLRRDMFFTLLTLSPQD